MLAAGPGPEVEFAAFFLDDAERPIRRREVRIQLNRQIALIQGRFVIAAVVMDAGDIARDDGRHRIERLRDAHLVQSLIQAAHRRQA